MAAGFLAISLAGCAHAVTIPERVDVGARRIQYRCWGRGSPTVILESGLGDPMDGWAEVIEEVRETTRVCGYDRAGLGKSDPGPEPRTAQAMVDDLGRLLERARIPGPYLLVGHSLGGLSMRLFASERPQSVVGLVLVEATPEEYPVRERELRPLAEQRRFENDLGLARPAARAEYAGIASSVAQVREAAPLPDIPLVVITAGRSDLPPALREAWQELQKELVTLTPQGRQIVANESGHFVQFDQPQIIGTAILDIVAGVRARGVAAPPR